ncbi:class I SAM-dependent methyltransferase [candidate division WWE3 bacterium]|nr:class I SAM-dependent methyltransferase [candidate division WWE3 bacterium]
MSKALWESVSRPAPGKIKDIDTYVSGNTLLDIGCAQGWYAQHAMKKGMKVLGTDLENFMVVKDVPFQQISFGQVDPGGDRTFDTVLMYDVLEHIVDEDDALRQLQKICNKRLLLSVPNADDKNLTDYNVTLTNRKDMTHQRYYTPDYLRKKLAEHGFEVIHMRYDGAVLPGIIGEFIRPKLLGKVISKIFNKLLFIGALKSPYFGDLYVVADKKHS